MMWRGCYVASVGGFTRTRGLRRRFPNKGNVRPRVRRAEEDRDGRRCPFTAITYMEPQK